MRTPQAICLLCITWCLCLCLAGSAPAQTPATSSIPIPSRPPQDQGPTPDGQVATSIVNDRTGLFSRETSSSTLERLPNLATLRSAQKKNGGLGTGVAYRTGRLVANSQAELHTEMYIHPAGLAPDASLSWLFTTATNRTEATVEVVGIYSGNNPGDLGIFDWSCSADDPCDNGATTPTWQWTKPFSAFSCNISRIVNKAGHAQEILSYTNTSIKLDNADPPHWQNLVYLWNYCTRSWDLIYQHHFHSAQKDCSLDGACGWWGPILETFDATEPKINAVGFQRTSLLHDNTWSLLSVNETTFISPGSPWKLYFLDPNKGYEAGNAVTMGTSPIAIAVLLLH